MASLANGLRPLTYRESLRDIETCLGAVGGKLYWFQQERFLA